MTKAAQTGLVGRMMDVLSDLPDLPAIGDLKTALTLNGAALSSAERRARLALRIALMKRGDFAAPLGDQMDPGPQPDAAEPEPAPEPEVVAPPPPPPPPKPAKVSLSSVRLEDAAFLLNAFSTPADPEADAARPVAAAGAKASDPEDQPKKAPRSAGIADLGAAFAAMEPSEPEAEAPSISDLASEAPETAPSLPPRAKKGRKTGSAVADLAGAAAALASLQAMDTETAASEPADTRPDPD